MKKTIKYLGVAAATLLAVSPVVAPVLTDSVTTVKAATPTDDEIKTAIDDVLASLNDTSYGTDSSDINTSFPNLLNSGDINKPYSDDGNKLADTSFQSGDICTGGVFVNGANDGLLSKMDNSKVTSTDISVLSSAGTSVYVHTDIIGDDGNPIDLSISNPKFINTINNIKNVRDNGGSLNLRTTITYNGKTYGDPVNYTLTNDNKKSADESDVKTAISEFKSNLKDVSNLRINDNYPQLSNDMINDYKNDAVYPGQEIIRGYNNEFSSYDLFKTLGIGAAIDKFSDSSNKIFEDNNVNIVLKVENSDGEVITDRDTLNKMTQNNDPFKLDISFQYPENGEMKDVDGGEVTFTPKDAMTNVTATYTDPLHVKDGSKVSDVNNLKSDVNNLKSDVNNLKSDVTFDSGDGDKAIASGKSNDNNFYSSAEAAWDVLVNSGSDEPVDVGDTFDVSKGTKYYQIIDATVPDEFQTFMNNISMGSSEYILSVNGNKINSPQDDDNKVCTSGSDLYFIREIQVDKASKPSNPSNNNSNNNQSAITGVATTHTDKGYYALYDSNNKKVDDRALLKNTSWKVDQVRTINGIKQYRVSTSEWVNASDVDFNENGEITDGLSVQNLDKVQKIDLSTEHNHYGLYNSKKKVSTNRALAGGTSWLVDKIGTDSDGNTYYGVSTDEYVKADDGVSISK